MEADRISIEQMALDRLRRTYEDQGYEFWREPAAALLPPFLNDLQYRPDAIAIKGNEGIVIEVKLKRSSASSQRLIDLAARIEAQKGWHMRVLFLSDEPDHLPPELPDVPAASVRAQAVEAQQLWQNGHQRAALLLGWAALEAAVRTAVHKLDAKASTRLQTGRQVLGTAATYGLIEGDEENRLAQVMLLRNAVAHGDFAQSPDQEAFKTLMEVIHSILTEAATTTH